MNLILRIVLSTAVFHVVLADSYLRGQNASIEIGKSVDKIHEVTRGIDSKEERVLMLMPLDGRYQIIGSFEKKVVVDPPTLSILNLTVNDSGVYRIQTTVLLTKDKVTKTVNIEVIAVPQVTAAPVDTPAVDVGSGYYEAARCKATGGSPQAGLKWIRKDTGSVQESVESTEPLDDGTFTVKSVLLLKPGLLGRRRNSTKRISDGDLNKVFVCVATHKNFTNGGEIRKPVTVELLYPPHVSISVTGNRLSCNAFGNPRPYIMWKKPDGNIEPGVKDIYVDQSNPTKSNGRYVCLAENSVGPVTIAAVNIQKPEKLPTIFTGTLRYNASLPLNAQNYDMECMTELNSVELPSASNVFFEWRKDGKKIQEELSAYKIFRNTTRVSQEKTTVSSTLRILKVERPRDEADFKCRLVISDTLSGYVRAVERNINIKVDYPPEQGSVRIRVRPGSTVRERDLVKMRCSAVSRPASSFRWFFKGEEVGIGAELSLRNISRNKAGTYECVAFNYVPGSAFTRTNLVVNYPPGRAGITKHKKGLSCYTEGGSKPDPHYTWLLPNGTLRTTNDSFLPLSTFDVMKSMSYMCLATNALGETNATFVLQTSGRVTIGSLSIGEFIVTVIVVVLLVTIVVTIVIWISRKRMCARKSIGANHKKDSKPSKLLKYSEHPYGGSLASMSTPHNVFDDCTVVCGMNDVNVSQKKKGSVEIATDDVSNSRSDAKDSVTCPDNPGYVTLNLNSNILKLRDGNNTPGRYRSVEALDGSGVEVVDDVSFGSVGIQTSERPSKTTNASRSSPLKLSTFSQPSHNVNGGSGTYKNYFTTRNPTRERPKESSLTRASSENFNQAHHGVHEKLVKKILSPAPPAYPGQPRNESPGPVISTPISESRFPDVVKNDRGIGYPSGSPSRWRSSQEKGVSSSNRYPSLKHNVVSQDLHYTYPLSDSEFHESPASSRCQSVDPTCNLACTPPMAELPVRSYLYQPYADGKLPQIASKSGVCSDSANLSQYDSGSDSTKSSTATTVTSSGRRMQSLTLV